MLDKRIEDKEKAICSNVLTDKEKELLDWQVSGLKLAGGIYQGLNNHS